MHRANRKLPKGIRQESRYCKGRLFIVSAPSGAGKTTLCHALRQHFGDLAYSVSYTICAPRRGEQDGRDYHFISKRQFEEGIAQARWAEWARVHGHYYGTSAQEIESDLAAGKSILMDIDVQGTRQMLQRFSDAVTLFIMPPSLDAIRQRLQARGTDDEASIALRIRNARVEIAQKDLYRHVIVNDDLDRAKRELIQLVTQYYGTPCTPK